MGLALLGSAATASVGRLLCGAWFFEAEDCSESRSAADVGQGPTIANVGLTAAANLRHWLAAQSNAALDLLVHHICITL